MTTLTQVQREDTLDLAQLDAELVRMESTKLDRIADTRTVGFHSTEGLSYVTLDGLAAETPMIGPDAEGHYTQGFRLRDHAHGQVATKLGIPKRYYDRLRDEAPTLLDANVRHWFVEQPERRMFRFLDGELRAFVSDRYRRLDNYDLVRAAVQPAFYDVEGLRFQVAQLTPDRLTIRALLPSLEREVKLGDVVQAGVQIRNSEVGAGKLDISPFIWRLTCLNGMVIPEAGLAAYHVGRKIEDLEESYAIFKPDTLAADDKAFFLKARDAIKAAVTDEHFDEIVNGLRAITTGETIVKPVKATEKLTNSLGLTEGEGEGLLERLVGGGDLSQWGAVNAVTNLAQAADSFERQVELERAGGELAALPAREWERIAIAA